MKTCPRCGRSLPDPFFRAKTAMCSKCRKKYDKGRSRNGDPIREVTLSAKARKRRWARANRNPQREAAYRIVRTAIEEGRIAPHYSCDCCGKTLNRRGNRRFIQAHHLLGYDKPLDVLWLCPKCHRKADDAARQPTHAGREGM